MVLPHSGGELPLSALFLIGTHMVAFHFTREIKGLMRWLDGLPGPQPRKDSYCRTSLANWQNNVDP